MIGRALLPLILIGVLSGCVSDGTKKPQLGLPPIPEDIKACARKYVPRPAGSAALTERELYVLVGKLKASDEAKSGCLERLIGLYEVNASIIAEALR